MFGAFFIDSKNSVSWKPDNTRGRYSPKLGRVSPLLCTGVSSLYCSYNVCRRKIEMSPGAQSRNDTPGRSKDKQHPCCSGRLRSPATGEAETGSAGEQPVKE